MDRLSQLLATAFAEGDALQANALISEHREGGAWSYEVDLSGEAPVERLLRDVLPRLVYFLVSRGTAGGEGVFLSLFRDGRVHFVSASDALGLCEAWTGESRAEWKARYGQGFSQT